MKINKKLLIISGFLLLFVLTVSSAFASSKPEEIFKQVLKNQNLVEEFSVNVKTTIYLPKQLVSHQVKILKTRERSLVSRYPVFVEIKGTEEGWILNNLPWVYLPPDFSLLQHALPSGKYRVDNEPLAGIESWYQISEVSEKGQNGLMVLKLENPFQKLELSVDPGIGVIKTVRVFDQAGDEVAEIYYYNFNEIQKAYLPSRIEVLRKGNLLMLVELMDWDLSPSGDISVVVSEDGRINELKDLLKANPDNANLHFQLAKEFEALGKVNQAIDEYKKAIELQENVSYLKALRDILYSQQKWDQAFKWAEKIINLKVAEANDYFIMGEICIRLHNPVLAREAFEKAVEKDDEYIQAWERLYWIYLNLAQEDRTFLNKALNAALKLVAINPGKFEFRNYLGDVYLKLGRHEDAFKEYQKAIQLSPDNGWNYIKLAQYYEAIDQAQLARQLYKKAVEVTGEWWSYEAYGNFLKTQKEYQKAEEAFKAAFSLNPERVELAVNLGKVLFKNEKTQEALKVWMEALSYARGDIYTYLRIGKILQEYGFSEEAEKVFEEASNLFVPDAQTSSLQKEVIGEIHYRLGLGYYIKGEKSKSLEFFARAFPHLPHPGAVFLLGRSFLAEGMIARAQEIWQKGFKKSPADNLKTGLGLIHLLQGNVETARWYFSEIENKILQELVKVWEELPFVAGLNQNQNVEWQGLELLKKGEFDSALKELEEYLKDNPHSLEVKLILVAFHSLCNSEMAEHYYDALLEDTANSVWVKAAGLFRDACEYLFEIEPVFE